MPKALVPNAFFSEIIAATVQGFFDRSVAAAEGKREEAAEKFLVKSIFLPHATADHCVHNC